jgi:GT2 family glycosyltransferase
VATNRRSALTVLVICTRNRPMSLQTTLKHLVRRSSVSPSTIIIVDSSDEKMELRNFLQAWSPPQLTIKVLDSSPGLPHQRNVAMEFIARHGVQENWQFVSFIDDDVLVGENYFRNLESLFLKYPHVNALGGFVKSTPAGKVRSIRWASLDRHGHLAPTGLTSSGTATLELQEVDWVPGGMQNLRLSVTQRFRYNGLKRMYGEDIEFSMILRRSGVKLFTSSLLGVHHGSAQSQKDNRFMVGYYTAANRLRLAQDFPEFLSLTKTKLSIVFVGVTQLLFGLASLSASRASFGLGTIAILPSLIRAQDYGSLEDNVPTI